MKYLGDLVKQFSETDFNADLKKIDVPTLILHGDDDQIVSYDSAMLSAKIDPGKATIREHYDLFMQLSVAIQSGALAPSA